MEILTPDLVIQEIRRISLESGKAPQAIFDAESKLANLEAEYERTVALAFLNSQGTVADRQALAKLAGVDLRLQADLAKAELNRVKSKAKQLSEAGILMATIAKSVDSTYRG